MTNEEVEQIVKEREECKHRAEVAERALLLACVNVVKDEKYLEAENAALREKVFVFERAFSNLVHEMYENGIRPVCDEKFFIESRLKDAEKELAEEGKE